LIVTDWEETLSVGVPEMTPVQPSTVTPAGRDPENTDTTALLSSVGVNEKDNPSPMIKLV